MQHSLLLLQHAPPQPLAHAVVPAAARTVPAAARRPRQQQRRRVPAAQAPGGSDGAPPPPPVRRSKQHTARKELQKQAQQEYIRRIYEAADRVEGDELVFQLQPASPRVRAELQESEQAAALNRALAQQVPQLQDAQQLAAFLQQHGASLNFLNVVALVTQAATLQQQRSDGPDTPAQLAPQLAELVLQASSWFEPAHFAACATGLAALGLRDCGVWDSFCAASEHKLGAFTFEQLAGTLQALALSGFTPSLRWIERTHRQAGKHMHAADPADIAVLVWAWGVMGYTPRDRPFMNQVKILTRRGFSKLPGLALVQLLHGLARMPRYAPNPGWVAAAAKAARPQLQALPPGALLDLLLSLAALRFSPDEAWSAAALDRVQRCMAAALPDQHQQQQQQEGALFLTPLSQLHPGYGMPAAPSLLLDGDDDGRAQQGGWQQQQLALEELQRLQDLFEEAAAAAGDEPEQQQPQGYTTPSRQPADGPLLTAAADAAGAAVLPPEPFSRQLTVEHLGMLCWCLGRVEHVPPPAWMQQLGQLLLLHSASAPAHVLVDACLGCVAAGYLPCGQLQVALLGALQQRLPAMPHDCLWRCCQALSRYEAGLRAACQQLPGSGGGDDVEAAAAAAAAAAYGHYVQVQRPALAEAILQREAELLLRASTAQLADVLGFLAGAGATPPLEFMAEAVPRAVAGLPAGCPTRAVATLLWALARLGFKPHPALLHQLLAALQRGGLHVLGPQELADAGWALSTLRHRPGAAWLALYVKEAASKAAYMPPQALTDTLWALACFAVQPGRETLKLFVLAAGRAAAGNGGQAAQPLGRRNAAVVVWALQQMGLAQAQLLGYGGGVGEALQQLMAVVDG